MRQLIVPYKDMYRCQTASLEAQVDKAADNTAVTTGNDCALHMHEEFRLASPWTLLHLIVHRHCKLESEVQMS